MKNKNKIWGKVYWYFVAFSCLIIAVGFSLFLTNNKKETVYYKSQITKDTIRLKDYKPLDFERMSYDAYYRESAYMLTLLEYEIDSLDKLITIPGNIFVISFCGQSTMYEFINDTIVIFTTKK